jgi:hypothetical protein
MMLEIVRLIRFCPDRSQAIYHHEIDTSMNFFEVIRISQLGPEGSRVFENIFLWHDKVPPVSSIEREDLIHEGEKSDSVGLCIIADHVPTIQAV